MDLLQALIRGPVQEAAEVLTLSSSAHWVAALWCDDLALIVSLVLHLGILAAGLVYFWRDWLTLWCARLYALRTRFTQDPEVRLLRLVGPVPAAGFLLEDPHSVFEPSLAAVMGPALAAWLAIWGRLATADRTSSDRHVCKALCVRLAQAEAIRPCSRRTRSAVIRWRSPRLAAGLYWRLAVPNVPGAGDQASLHRRSGNMDAGPTRIVPLWESHAAAAVMGVGCDWLLPVRRWRWFAGVSAGFGALSLPVALLL